MEIREIALKKYVQVDRFASQSAIRKFSVSSNDYLDELEVFLESIEFMLGGLGDSDGDERFEIYFNKELSNIEVVMDGVCKNKSLVDNGAVTSESEIKSVEKNRLIVIMYLRSIFKILCEHLDK